MMKIRVGDYFVFLVAIFVFLVSIQYSGGTEGAPIIEIESQAGRFLYPLDIDQKFVIPGPQGECEVEISNDELRIVGSDCLDKICQNLTPLRKNGDWTACLPNSVMITLTGAPDKTPLEPDSMAF